MYLYPFYPIEVFLRVTFDGLFSITNSYLLSIVLLALFIYLVTRPLASIARMYSEKESEVLSVLTPQVEMIKQTWSGIEQHQAIQRLYRRYRYSPVYSIRSLLPLVTQLPFLVAAFYMLSSYEAFRGVQVPFLGDLGRSDGLLFGYVNLIPFVMTFVNILVLLTTPKVTKKAIVQGGLVSLVFLILLYESPLALLIYWTSTNFFLLIANFLPTLPEKYKASNFLGHIRRSYLGQLFEEYGYLFFVVNLSVLIPLLGVLGDQYTFFSAHNMNGRLILKFIFIMMALLPLFLCQIRWLCKKVKAEKFFDIVIIALCLELFFLYIFNKAGNGFFPESYEPQILFAFSILASSVCLFGIIKDKKIKYLAALSVVIPFVFVNFVFISPSSALFKNISLSTKESPLAQKDIPVFFLILDEFSGLTLQNLNREMDVERYPGFAELASKAVYFPNALTSAYTTVSSIPNILNGAKSSEKHGELDRENNLLSFFRSNVGQTNCYSRVVPSEYNSLSDVFSYRMFASDLLTLYLHIVLHDGWISEKIGCIPPSWKNFGVFKAANEDYTEALTDRRVRLFLNWIDAFSGSYDQFNFLHLVYPHVPYNISALGRIVESDRLVGDGNSKQIWLKIMETDDKGKLINRFVNSEPNINVVYHNYLKAVSYSDQLIKKLVHTLKSKKLFEKSLIIITADHGVSYQKEGGARRIPNGDIDNWGDIVSVPLLIKYPHQTKGEVNESLVTTLDVAPTILDVFGVKALATFEGESLRGIGRNVKTKSVKLIPEYEKNFSMIDAVFAKNLAHKNRLFGEKTPVYDIAVNYTENSLYDHLLGKHVDSLKVSGRSGLNIVFRGAERPNELVYYGSVFDKGSPVNNRTLLVAEGGIVKAITQSGKVHKGEKGFFAFSIPERTGLAELIDFSMFEVCCDNGSVLLKKVDNLLSREDYFYTLPSVVFNWKKSVVRYNYLDEFRVTDDGIFIRSSQKDPGVVFKQSSQGILSNPIIKINLKSNKQLTLTTFYQTASMPKFSGEQYVRCTVAKGENTLFIKIPKRDFNGVFRIDPGEGGQTEVLLKSIEIRTS